MLHLHTFLSCGGAKCRSSWDSLTLLMPDCNPHPVGLVRRVFLYFIQGCWAQFYGKIEYTHLLFPDLFNILCSCKNTNLAKPRKIKNLKLVIVEFFVKYLIYNSHYFLASFQLSKFNNEMLVSWIYSAGAYFHRVWHITEENDYRDFPLLRPDQISHTSACQWVLNCPQNEPNI